MAAARQFAGLQQVAVRQQALELPVRLDADPESLTPVGKKALEDLNAASVVMGAPTFADMDLIIMDFANGVLTKEEFIAMFQEALYP